MYLANDVIQNSKKKGPEFTKDFESVLVDACSHVARYTNATTLKVIGVTRALASEIVKMI